jgi:lipopolysaccharide transport system ATP-binding protein
LLGFKRPERDLLMSSEAAIRVSEVSKCYHIYDTPRDRLKQFVLPRIDRLRGRSPRACYTEFWALRDISFEVRRGESVGILGRNGSGKSTLLQIICGTLNPTSGSVVTHGRVAALLELGSGFNPEFTGRENVYMNGALLGLSRDQVDERFDAIASFADIGDHLDQPVKTYSSGMLVRLAFAVQVQVEPDILIVDEALAVGDALFQKRCFQRIEKLLSDGVTLLFVSHDIESVRTLTHRSLLLKSGRAISWGISSEVVLDYRRHLHEDEARYFAALTESLEAKAASASPPVARPAPSMVEAAPESFRSDRFSFGDGEVEVLRVETLNSAGTPENIFYPGDRLRIRVTCRASRAASKLNVGVRLRSKEGVKVYSWGTLNQDMAVMSSGSGDPLFWNASFKAGDEFAVLLECGCDLGINLYEVQVSVSHEGTPDYLNQRILHWRDEAAFFQVLMRRHEYFFGGLVDLKMSADWEGRVMSCRGPANLEEER